MKLKKFKNFRGKQLVNLKEVIMAKERADVLCVSQGLFESREKAKRAIMAGIVYNDNIRIDKVEVHTTNSHSSDEI